MPLIKTGIIGGGRHDRNHNLVFTFTGFQIVAGHFSAISLNTPLITVFYGYARALRELLGLERLAMKVSICMDGGELKS